MSKKVGNVSLVIDYIEDHLHEKLSLNKNADGVHYSSYHVHRLFMDTVGMTIHDYTIRRKLSEAAKLLVYSDRTIMEIALITGYESQRAFSTIFKQMYKKTPNQYRRAELFYPLQLRYDLYRHLIKFNADFDWHANIRYATHTDTVDWMRFLKLVIDGFPYLNELEYARQLSNYIHKRQAFVMIDYHQIIGTMLWNNDTSHIDFLGVHPQFKKEQIMTAFLEKIKEEFTDVTSISTTTFREGMDLGYRNVLPKLGFQAVEYMIEFGYPTQKMIKNHIDRNPLG